MALSAAVNGHGGDGDGMTVGLDIKVVFSNTNDSIILWYLCHR